MTQHSGPALTLALYQPDIPQNCGTMLRLCACLGMDAAIIEPAGFPMSDRAFRRAGMDYLDHVTIARHGSFAAFAPGARRRRAGSCCSRPRLRRIIAISTMRRAIFACRAGIVGVPEDVRAAADASVRISIRPPLRSLNVAVAAAMVLGEAVRQIRSAE